MATRHTTAHHAPVQSEKLRRTDWLIVATITAPAWSFALYAVAAMLFGSLLFGEG